VDHHGLKHRIKEKSLAEENLEKIEKVVTEEFFLS
jgi:hypothetical protein